MQGLSCFWTILSALPYTCLVLLALFCFACFLGVNRFLVGIIFILVKYLSFFAFRILYRTISYPYHIIYLASISSYVFLFLCLKEMLCIRLFAPFICLFSGFTLYFFFPCYLIVIFTEQNWWKTIFFMKMGYFYSILLV